MTALIQVDLCVGCKVPLENATCTHTRRSSSLRWFQTDFEHYGLATFKIVCLISLSTIRIAVTDRKLKCGVLFVTFQVPHITLG